MWQSLFSLSLFCKLEEEGRNKSGFCISKWFASVETFALSVDADQNDKKSGVPRRRCSSGVGWGGEGGGAGEEGARKCISQRRFGNQEVVVVEEQAQELFFFFGAADDFQLTSYHYYRTCTTANAKLQVDGLDGA